MNDQFTGKVLADKYRIDSLLTENSLGSFYKATHLTMEKPVSVKILAPALASDESIVKHFADEARTASRVSHPNILNVTDYGSDKDGAIFIVYDDASGETLKNIVEERGKLPLAFAASVVSQVAAALSAAHANGIAHKNLTSESILIRENGGNAADVKVLNLGLAQAEGFDDLNSTQSVYYLSPEQCAGEKADERADIYSLGVIAYEMLAGEVPFQGAQPTDVMLKHKEELPPPMSAFRKDLPVDLETVLLTALAKNPESRYQSIKEFAEDFNQTSGVGAVALNQTNVAAIAKQPAAQNNIWKTAFIVLAGISLLGAFFIYSTATKQTEPATQLMTDANGIPVQPINPATGMTEQSLSNMSSFSSEMFSNSNSAMIQQMQQQMPSAVAPGGDGYDPWASGKPPAGAPPTYVGPGGQQVYVDGSGSIFMPGMQSDANTYILVPKNTNTAANANTQPRNRNSNTSTNTSTANTAANTRANTSVKPTPAPPAANTGAQPNVKPSPAKPTPSPRKTPATSGSGTRPSSGTVQDSD